MINRNLVTACFLFSYLLFYTQAKKLYTYDPVQCTYSDTNESDQCNTCFKSASWLQRDDLQSSSELNSSSFTFKKLNETYLTWSYNGDNLISFSNFSITLFTWNVESKTGEPFPSCCNIPFTSGGCPIDSCFNRPVYISVPRNDTYALERLSFFSSCSNSRRYVRYFNLCANLTASVYDHCACQCVIYDSMTGKLIPGFLPSGQVNASSNAVWYTESKQNNYEICYFTMNKDDVIQRGELFQPDEAIDSIVFRRSVYYMANYTGQDGRVIDQNTNTTINCTRRRYQGTDVFNISSNVVENSTVRHDKNTFLCLSMWPNGTDRVRPEAINVKCMPQNDTESDIYVPEEEHTFVDVIMIILPILSLLFLACICYFIFQNARSKVRKFIKDTKCVPKEVDDAMMETFNSFADINYCEVKKEEKVDAFDDEEKKKIVYIRQRRNRSINNVVQSSSSSYQEERDCNFSMNVLQLNNTQVLDSGSPPDIKADASDDTDPNKSRSVSLKDSGLHKLKSSTLACNDDVFTPGDLTFTLSDVIDFKAQTVYWSKEDGGRENDRPSASSVDTGFDPGSLASDEDDMNAIESSTNEEQKRVCCKTTSKDSGVIGMQSPVTA